MRFNRFAKLALVTVMASCTGWPQTRPVPPAQATAYKLAFDEEFDTLDLSPDGSGAHSWYEGVWFNQWRAPRSNISVHSSSLSLAWRRGQVAPDTSVATLARDKQHFEAWRYGYFEARMKWDVVRGAWPGFWLLPVDDATGNSTYDGIRESGELDVFEGLGEHPHNFYGTIHDWVNFKDTASKENTFPLPENIDLSDYHTYGALWVPGKVTWYFDNRPLHSEKTPAVFDKQKYCLILTIQEGVNMKAGDMSGVDANTITLKVDWVRVWQK